MSKIHEGQIFEHYLVKHGISAKEASDKMGLTRAMIYYYYKQESLSKKVKRDMARTFGQELATLLSVSPDIVTEPQADYKKVPVVNKEAFATISPAMTGAISLKSETLVNIPIFSNAEYAMPVQGHSMRGFIDHGDLVAIRRINNHNFIIYGRCYLIVTKSDNFVTVKFLHEDVNSEDNLILTPYNIEQFNSQTIPKSEILELHEVIGVIRKV